MPTLVTFLGGAVLLVALIQLARVDWATHRLPNILTLPLLGAGLIWAYWTVDDLYPHLLGAALGYGVFWTVEVAYRVIRKRDGLGRGDAKLLAAGGAWCGVWALPAIVLIASLAALAYVLPKANDHQTRIAFGPFLAIGIGGVWLAQRILT